MKRRRYVYASVIAVAGFSALFAVLPGQGAGLKVKMVGLRYRPAVISVHRGGAVTFSNETTLTHTATCSRCGVDSGDVQPKTFKTVTFPKAGRFQLFCRYHGNRGMIAIVTVSP